MKKRELEKGANWKEMIESVKDVWRCSSKALYSAHTLFQLFANSGFFGLVLLPAVLAAAR